MASTALLPHRPHGGHEPLLRLRVRLERATLDRRLAEGASPASTRALARRARQLATPRAAADVAEWLEAIMREAEEPPLGLSARVPLERAQIAAARPFLFNLIDRLRDVEDPRAHGVAQALVLVSEGASPLYAPAHPGTLASRAWRAADAL